MESLELKVGDMVYEKQPRFFDYDYHPQTVVEINENIVKVFEPGYFPNGKYFEISIKKFYKEKDIIVHC